MESIRFYWTSIILVVWAVFLLITGDNPMVPGLIAVAVAVIIQIKALRNLYKRRSV